MTMGMLARASAVLIAVAALIDPVLTRTVAHRQRTSIVVVDSPTLDYPVSSVDARTRRTIAQEAARRLADLVPGATLEAAPGIDAAAVILVGDSLDTRLPIPPSADVVTVTVGDSLTPNVSVDDVTVPAHVGRGDRVVATVGLSGAGVAGRVTTVSLVAGTLTVSQHQHTWRDSEAQVRVPLEFVPWQAGPLPLRAIVTHSGAQATTLDDHADALVMVEDRPVRVLVLDAVPAWMSRFVSVALEHASSFALSSRVTLGRNVVVKSGPAANARLDATALDEFDVVIVSSPGAEPRGVIEWLDAFMRNRGGAVVVLADETSDLVPVARWWPARWEAEALAVPETFTLAARPSLQVKATEVARIRTLPVPSRVIAAADGGDGQPGIVSHPVGLGTLVVNLAFDAWRFRADDDRAFTRAWLGLLHALGRGAARRLDLEALPVVRPGQPARVNVRVREPSSPGVSWLPDLRLEDGRDALWPLPAEGGYSTTLSSIARTDPSSFVVSVALEDIGGALLTRPDARVGASALPLSWLAAAHQGLATDTADALARIPPWLAGRPSATTRVSATWRPMRSPWWIVPFVGALGIEWYGRRRAGRR